MQPIHKTRFLATHYSSLQGLRSVPIGLCLLLVSLWANSLFGIITKDFTWPVIFVVGAVLLFITIDQYYKRTFGEVTRTPAARRTESILAIVGGVLILGAFWLDGSFELPFVSIGLAFAAAFVFDNPKALFPLNKFSGVILFFSACLIFLSVSPLFVGATWWNIFGIKSASLGICLLAGVFFMVAGLIWHAFLVTSLPVTEKDEK